MSRQTNRRWILSLYNSIIFHNKIWCYRDRSRWFQVTCRNRFCSTIHCAGSSTTWPEGRRTRNMWRTARASCLCPLASRTCPRSSYRSPRNSPGHRHNHRLLATTIHYHSIIIICNVLQFVCKKVENHCCRLYYLRIIGTNKCLY